MRQKRGVKEIRLINVYSNKTAIHVIKEFLIKNYYISMRGLFDYSDELSRDLIVVPVFAYGRHFSDMLCTMSGTPPRGFLLYHHDHKVVYERGATVRYFIYTGYHQSKWESLIRSLELIKQDLMNECNGTNPDSGISFILTSSKGGT